MVFTITLNGTVYTINIRSNVPGEFWYMDIADVQGNSIICGIPLVTGSNLLEQYAYLGIGGELIVQTDHDPYANPTVFNLGINSHLYYVTP